MGVCPAGPTDDKKDEVDVTFVSPEASTRRYSRSCTVESKQVPPTIPASLRAEPVGCTSAMTRLRGGDLTVEEWRLGDGTTVVELSRSGRDTKEDLERFRNDLVKLLVGEHKVKPLDASKSELGSQCAK